MEIQCPFSLNFEQIQSNLTFPEYLLDYRFPKFGKALALVDADSGRQWKYSELRSWVNHTMRNLAKESVTTSNRVGIVCQSCPEILILEMACGLMGITCTPLKSEATVDEMWHQVDLCEATNLVTQGQFLGKVEEIKKKAQARGAGKLRNIHLLDAIVFDPGHEITEKSAPPTPSGHNQPPTKKTGDVSGAKPPAPPGRLTPRGSAGKLIPSGTGVRGMERSRSNINLPLEDNDFIKNKLGRRTRDDSPASSVQEDQEGEYPLASQPESIRGSFSPAFLIFFSSGTTGLPKPVEINHRTFIVNVQQMSANYLGTPAAKDRILSQVPFHHIYGQLVAFYGLYNGATVVSVTKYKLDAFLKVIQDYKVSILHVTPPVINSLAEDGTVKKFDISTLQSITCSGAPIDPVLAEKCKHRIQVKDMRQLYGLTESCSALTWSYFGCKNIKSIGSPLPGTVFKVVHVEKRFLLGPEVHGELCVKGPQVFPKYYKNPKATNELIDKDGFLKTGDLGYYDAQGKIYVVDRVKDAIRIKGSQVYPTEVENMVRSHPGVADVAVVGRPEATGEVPAGFIIRKDDSPLLSAADIRMFIKGKSDWH